MTLIQQAVGAMSGDKKAPRVVSFLLLKHWDALYGDRDAARHLMALGLDHEVRPILTQYNDETPPGEADSGASGWTQASLSLWPEEERHLAEQIREIRAYVPSRGAHVVLYDSSQITPAELEEAGHYKITIGHGNIRQGNHILRLAQHRRGRQAAA